MHQTVLFKMLAIMDSINQFFGSIVDKVILYLNNIEPWAAGLVILGAAIFVLIGLFVFVKKFVKTFIVLAILGGALYLIYTQTELLNFLN